MFKYLAIFKYALISEWQSENLLEDSFNPFLPLKLQIMQRSQDPQSRDLPISSTLYYNSHTLYQISISFLEKRSFIRFKSISLLKKLLANQRFS